LLEGGFVNSGTGVSKNVDTYDVMTGTWTTTFMSVPRYQPTVNVVGNTVYFAGSGDGSNTIDVYDASNNTWKVLTLPTPLVSMCGVVINNQIFYAGGYTFGNYGVSELVQVYDIASNTWSTQKLSQARAGIAAGSFGNRYLFAGGLIKVTYPPVSSATVDIYTAP
jgi:hypothetical protein